MQQQNTQKGKIHKRYSEGHSRGTHSLGRMKLLCGQQTFWMHNIIDAFLSPLTEGHFSSKRRTTVLILCDRIRRYLLVTYKFEVHNVSL